MIKKLFVIISLLLAALCCSPRIFAQNHEMGWHEAKNITGNFKAVSTHPDIEVFSAPNVIMVKVNHGVDIRVFSILGKLISEERLEPGIYQFTIESHGIYIVKTSETSCKLAI